MLFSEFWQHWECRADFYMAIGTGKVKRNDILILMTADDINSIKIAKIRAEEYASHFSDDVISHVHSCAGQGNILSFK